MNLGLGKIGRRGTSELAAADALTTAQHRRIQAARACRAWTELNPADLVPRERGWVVHTDTDEAFAPYQGDWFSPAGLVLADMTPLAFYVDGDGVHVLERQSSPWSELVYQAERQKAVTR